MPTTLATDVQPAQPIYFRLPPKGGDPHFGFSRSFFYNGEKRGWWRLIRLREQGRSRGVTLVPYADVLNFVRAAEAESKAGFESQRGEGASLERERLAAG